MPSISYLGYYQAVQFRQAAFPYGNNGDVVVSVYLLSGILCSDGIYQLLLQEVLY